MTKLLCPICGREMTAIETYAGRGELYCGTCDLTIGGNEAKTPDELTAIIESGQNAKLRELVHELVHATHPADRATLIANAVELGIEAE